MLQKSIFSVLIASSVLTTNVYADHNSIWGAGSANMPNDIHNTRIEDDQETFLELVQQGGGADSVNRYADTDTESRLQTNRNRTFSRTSGARTVKMHRGGSPR